MDENAAADVVELDLALAKTLFAGDWKCPISRNHHLIFDVVARLNCSDPILNFEPDQKDERWLLV